MATYAYFSKINPKMYTELNAFRFYSKFLRKNECFPNATLNTSKITKVSYLQSRLVRGTSRIYVTENEDQTQDDEVTAGKTRATTTGIKKRQIKELLDNSTITKTAAKEETLDGWSTKPLPSKNYKGVNLTPRLDPNESSVLLFPGQGSQFVGMGKQLLKYPNVEKMYRVAGEILGYDLLNLCLNGPKSELDKTIYCQPAVVVTSLAAVEKLKDESPHFVDSCVAAAGFSVGEITALIFAGVLNFEDGIKLTRIRAEAMQTACDMEGGGMMTVFYGAEARIGFACRAAVEWCQKKGMNDPQCVVANYLYPGCKVIAGNVEALSFLKRTAKDFGIRKYKDLPVSGAFHTKLMLPAEESVRLALETLKLKEPMVSVLSNVDGKRYPSVSLIKRLLPRQISSPVKWEQVLHTLYKRPVEAGFPRTFECGPGKSLNAILEKVNGKAWNFITSIEC